MKKLLFPVFFAVILGLNSAAFSYEFTEEQKNAVYDLFLSTYLSSISQQVQAQPLPPDKKLQIINFAKRNANKQQLINETWGCVKTKVNTSQSEMNSCFISWGRKQSADLTEFMLKLY